jgi:hypothetical protein
VEIELRGAKLVGYLPRVPILVMATVTQANSFRQIASGVNTRGVRDCARGNFFSSFALAGIVSLDKLDCYMAPGLSAKLIGFSGIAMHVANASTKPSHRPHAPPGGRLKAGASQLFYLSEQRTACRVAGRRIKSRLAVRAQLTETTEGRMRVGRFIIAVAGVLFAGTAVAQTTQPSTGKGALRGACSAEAQKFCANAPRGKGKLRGCLQEHQAELSDACKTAVSAQPKE